jgi:hypothetical protein
MSTNNLNNYLKKGLQQSDKRAEHCISIGKSGEDLFIQLTGAVKSALKDDKKHIDCYWGDKLVDVKGLKPMHKQGYILLEFLNVWGLPGWCAKDSKAEYIAFQFPDRFYVIEKNKLRQRVVNLCEQYTQENVTRKNRVKPSQGLYKWIGRFGKQDVFTYLRLDDVLDIVFKEIPYTM